MKRYQDLIINIIYIFILNIILSFLIYKKVEILSILFYLNESIFVGSIIRLLSQTKSNKMNKLITFISLLFFTILFAAQFVHYKFYECFFSFYSLTKSGQIAAFYEAILKIIMENIFGFMMFIMMIPIIFTLVIKTRFIKDKGKMLVIFSLIVLSFSLTSLSLFINKSDIYSRYDLISNTHTSALNVKKLGLLTSSFIDLKRYFVEFDPILMDDNDNKYEYQKDDSIDYNVDKKSFNKVLKAKDKGIKNLTNYLKGVYPTNKNEYTGMFEGKNLIFITAESFNFNIIDKDITPTLYKMQKEGITFNNFYTPIYYASTSDGEYTNITGLLPEEGSWSYLKSQNNYFPYSYGNMLKDKGYKTYSYHDGAYDFYERNKVQNNFGFSVYKGCGNGLEKLINCNLWPQSDEEMLDKTFNDYKDEEHFIAYYMSISGHLSHDFNTNDMAKKWKKTTESLNYSKNVKAYISGNVDLDRALGKLLNNLEEAGKLNDTVIVITPDHFPYGLNRNELREIEKLENSFDIYKSGLIIYNPAIKPQKIDKLSSNIDVLPTLLNMFNINYDSRLVIGKDIMSNANPIVIFNDRSFLTDYGFYNAKTNEFTGKKVSKSYIKSKKIEVYNKTNASSLILNNDYYKYFK